MGKGSVIKKINPIMNLQKEDFSLAYVMALSTVAGYTMQIPRRDVESVDVNLQPFDESWPQLSIQLKCSWTWELFDSMGSPTPESEIQYDLSVKNYNELIAPVRGIPKILVLVVVPRDFTIWLRQSEKELVLQHCAFWKCLTGMPSSTNKQTQRISIPRNNVFDVLTLIQLMGKVEKGKSLC